MSDSETYVDVGTMRRSASPVAFTLHGCRELLELAIPIEQQIIALEEAVERNPGLAFDLAKTLIETACKTILNDRGQRPDEGWDLPKLYKETTSNLQLLPDGQADNAKMTEALRRTGGAFTALVQGLCEVRNLGGFASHGKDAYELAIGDAIQAQFVARSADTVVHYLFRVHYNYNGSSTRRTQIKYGDNPDFNDYIDANHREVLIFDLPYRASDVLFNTDQEAYRDKLAEFRSGATDGLAPECDE